MIAIVQDVIDEFKHLASALEADIGVFASGMAANIAHDVKVAGGDVAVLMSTDIAQVWQLVASHVVDDLAQGKSFQQTIDDAVTAFANFAWTNIAPALLTIGEATLKTIATQAASLAIAGLIASL